MTIDVSRTTVIAHSGRQYVGEAAYAAQETGMLLAYLTGTYFGGSSIPSRLARWASKRSSFWLLRSVSGRTYPQLHKERVVAFPREAILARLMRGLPRGEDLEREALVRWQQRVARWITSSPTPVRLVHAFEGQAEAIFSAAKRLGAVTVLDVNNAHEYINREFAREQLKTSPPHVLARINSERALADYMLAPSEFVRSCLIEHGVPAERIILLPLGASPRRAPVRDDLRRPTRVLFVGSIVARKGIHYLLDAWRSLSLPDAELVLVGAPDAFGQAALQTLPSRCRALGYISWSNLQAVFDDSDIFVLPSLAEGSALVNYQAMASGLPVVTTPNAGSVVRDGVDGYLVPPRDVDSLADRLVRLCERPDLRLRMGESAARRIESHFTWSHYRSRIVEVYRNLLLGRAPALRYM